MGNYATKRKGWRHVSTHVLPFPYELHLVPSPSSVQVQDAEPGGSPAEPASPSPGSRASLPPLIPGHNQSPSRDPAINSAPNLGPGAPGWLTVRPTLPKPGLQQWEHVITVSVSEPRLLPLPCPDSGSTGKRSGPGGCDGGGEGSGLERISCLLRAGRGVGRRG